MSRPVKYRNSTRINLSFRRDFLSALQNTRISSANNRCEIFGCIFRLIGLSCFKIIAVSNLMLRHSITKTNKYGERGSPCLMPLDELKDVEGMPLIDTEKVGAWIHSLIQLIQVCGNFIKCKI